MHPYFWGSSLSLKVCNKTGISKGDWHLNYLAQNCHSSQILDSRGCLLLLWSSQSNLSSILFIPVCIIEFQMSYLRFAIVVKTVYCFAHACPFHVHMIAKRSEKPFNFFLSPLLLMELHLSAGFWHLSEMGNWFSPWLFSSIRTCSLLWQIIALVIPQAKVC